MIISIPFELMKTRQLRWKMFLEAVSMMMASHLIDAFYKNGSCWNTLSNDCSVHPSNYYEVGASMRIGAYYTDQENHGFHADLSAHVDIYLNWRKADIYLPIQIYYYNSTTSLYILIKMTDTNEATPLIPQYVHFYPSSIRVMNLSLIYMLSAEPSISTRLKDFFVACVCGRHTCSFATNSPITASSRPAFSASSSTDTSDDISLSPSQSVQLEVSAAAAAAGVDPEVLKEQRRKEEEEQKKREAEEAAKKKGEKKETIKRERDEWRRQQAEEFAAIMNRFRDQSLYWGYWDHNSGCRRRDEGARDEMRWGGEWWRKDDGVERGGEGGGNVGELELGCLIFLCS